MRVTSWSRDTVACGTYYVVTLRLNTNPASDRLDIAYLRVNAAETRPERYGANHVERRGTRSGGPEVDNSTASGDMMCYGQIHQVVDSC